MSPLCGVLEPPEGTTNKQCKLLEDHQLGLPERGKFAERKRSYQGEDSK